MSCCFCELEWVAGTAELSSFACNPPLASPQQQEHTDILRSLRFTLAFVHYVMEIAALKGSSSDMSSSVTSEYQLQESVVADQISLLSREWR